MQLAEAENKITNYKIALGLSLLLGTIIFALVIQLVIQSFVHQVNNLKSQIKSFWNRGCYEYVLDKEGIQQIKHSHEVIR